MTADFNPPGFDWFVVFFPDPFTAYYFVTNIAFSSEIYWIHWHYGDKDCSDKWKLIVPYFVKLQEYIELFSEILIDEFS